MEDRGETFFYHVFPNSHHWTSIEMILENLKYRLEIDIDYLRIGLENTLKNGYNIQKVKEDGNKTNRQT